MATFTASSIYIPSTSPSFGTGNSDTTSQKGRNIRPDIEDRCYRSLMKLASGSSGSCPSRETHTMLRLEIGLIIES